MDPVNHDTIGTLACFLIAAILTLHYLRSTR